MITVYDLRKVQDDEAIKDVQTHFGAPLNVVALDDASLQACKGCWDCWLKTPGRCVIEDGMAEHYGDYMKSDKVVLLMDTAQGFIDHKAKAFIDRTIPHYHPHIALVKGECRHKERYENYPDLFFHFESARLTEQEEEIIVRYLARTADHFRSDGYRFFAGEEPKTVKLKPKKPMRRTIPFENVEKDARWVIYMGSPRLSRSNSALILDHVAESLGDRVEVRDLKKTDQWPTWAKAFPKEKHVLFFLPLYVHAMPSHVMHFIEGLEPSEGNIAFFIQSGFPESAQSHYLEGYFERLSSRLGRRYAGTAIKGGVEGLQYRPQDQQEKMIAPMRAAIEHLVKEGHYRQDHIKALARPVRFRGVVRLIVKRVFKRGGVNNFWDQLLQKNDAYEKRDDRPYEQAATD